MFLRWGGRCSHSESGTGSAIIDAATADAILAEVGFLVDVGVRLALSWLGKEHHDEALQVRGERTAVRREGPIHGL